LVSSTDLHDASPSSELPVLTLLTTSFDFSRSAWSTTMSTCSISLHGPDTLLLGRWAIRLTRTCSADTGQTADPSTALVQYVTTACDNSSSRRNNDLLAEHLLVVGGMIDIA